MPDMPRRELRPALTGVAANQRLTALTGALLLALLAALGITVLSVRELLLQHMFIGLLLIPPVLLKLASTGYRFFRYYTGDMSYRAAGRPPLLSRLLAIVMVVSTVVVFATGVELWLVGLRFGSLWVLAHKASFVVWLVAATLHVLRHLDVTTRAAREEARGTMSEGAFTRRSLVVGSLVTGVVIAIASLAYASPFVVFGDG